VLRVVLPVIDTMQLLLTDYDASKAKLILQPSSVDMKTGAVQGNFPLWHNGEKMVEGAYAYHRDDHFNVTIKPQPRPGGLGVGTACYVRFEVPKFAGGNNYHPVDEKGTKKALGDAEKCLKAVGIRTDVRTAQISRLDAFKNVVAAEPMSCYQGVLSVLSGRRMKQRGYENGFLWENGSQEICVYDKLQKMRHDKLGIKGLPRNSQRFEWRGLKARKIRDSLGFRTVGELLADYERVREFYHETMQKHLFRYSVKDVEVLLASDIKAEMVFFQENYGREWLSHYLRVFGLHSLLQKASLETVLGVVEEIAESKMKKSRLKSDLQRYRFQAESLTCFGDSKRTTGQLYEELKSKVLEA
jgi:hypothetical protein